MFLWQWLGIAFGSSLFGCMDGYVQGQRVKAPSQTRLRNNINTQLTALQQIQKGRSQYMKASAEKQISSHSWSGQATAEFDPYERLEMGSSSNGTWLVTGLPFLRASTLVHGNSYSTLTWFVTTLASSAATLRCGFESMPSTMTRYGRRYSSRCPAAGQ